MFRHSLVGLAALALLAACSDGRDAISPSATQPALGISDGAHSSGNQDFFFMPPIASNPVNNPAFEAGKFNGKLKPVVSICMLDQALVPACVTGNPIKTFSSAEISVSDQQYHVNWDTKATPLQLSRMYRISVTVGTKLIGYVDVDPVSNGSQLRSVNTNEYIGLVDGKTLPIKFRIEQGATCVNRGDCAEETVTNAGSTVLTSSGYAGVRFPSGWLPTNRETGKPYEDVVVKIERVPTGSDNRCHSNIQMLQFEGCYQFTTDPYVGRFAKSVTAGVCPELSPNDPRYNQLAFYTSGPGEETMEAPEAAAPFVNCDGFAGTPPQIGALGRVSREVFAMFNRAAKLISPKSAYAIDLGWGADLIEFSRGGWVLETDIAENGGNNQTAAPGALLPTQISVRVTGHHGRPVQGVAIDFGAGAGSLGASADTTDANGIASTTWTLGSAAGSQNAFASVHGIGDGPTITFTATGTPVIPNPILAYRHSEQYMANDQDWDRYRLTVTNRASYSESMFAIDPNAPACASNARVNIYDGTTHAYIYGFCGLSEPDELNDIWFAVPRWTQPPASVYITITDRAADVIYTSNTISLYAPLFVNFPRAVLFDGTNAVAGATSYTLEVQVCGNWPSPDWRPCSSTWVDHLTVTLPAGAWSSTQIVAGDNTYRWRVVARNDAGAVVNATDYKHFRYITGPAAP